MRPVTKGQDCALIGRKQKVVQLNVLTSEETMQRYIKKYVCMYSIISASSTESTVVASWFLHHTLPLSFYLHSFASLSAHLPTFITSLTLQPFSSFHPLLILEPVHHHHHVFLCDASTSASFLPLFLPPSSLYLLFSASCMLSSCSPYRSLPFLQLSSLFPISLSLSCSLFLSSDPLLPPSLNTTTTSAPERRLIG